VSSFTRRNYCSTLTGWGDAGFGKRSESLVKPEFKVSSLKVMTKYLQIDTTSVGAHSQSTPTMPLVNLEHQFSIVESPDPFRAGVIVSNQ